MSSRVSCGLSAGGLQLPTTPPPGDLGGPLHWHEMPSLTAPPSWPRMEAGSCHCSDSVPEQREAGGDVCRGQATSWGAGVADRAP